MIKKSKKIIFREISTFVVRAFDFKSTIPNIQNNATFILIKRFPNIKLIGKKPKTKFANKIVLKFNFFLITLILNLMIPKNFF